MFKCCATHSIHMNCHATLICFISAVTFILPATDALPSISNLFQLDFCHQTLENTQHISSSKKKLQRFFVTLPLIGTGD